MPFDSAGNFTRNYSWVADRDAGIKIEAVRMDAEFDNFAAGMNQLFLRNGTSPISGDINLNGFGIDSLKLGSAASPSIWFTGDPNTGIYSPGADQVSITAGGNPILQVTSTGVTIPGTLQANSVTVEGPNIIDGPVGTNRPLYYQTSGSYRWALYAGTVAESGGNAGSNFNIARYDDTGTLIDNPLTITRSTGVVNIGNSGLSSGGLILCTGNYAATGPITAVRGYFIQTTTNNTNRWGMTADTAAESGSNAGANFNLRRYSDAGVLIDIPLTISRATGLVTLADGAAIPAGQLVIGSSGSVNGLAVLNGPGNGPRGLDMQTNGSERWRVIADGAAEAAGNVGTNFVINRYDNNGNYIDQPFTIQRNTGLVGIPRGLSVSNGLTVANGFNGTGGMNFDAITAGSSFTSSGPTTLNGITTANQNIIANGGAQFVINGAAGTARYVTFDTNNVVRWTIFADSSAEGGSNAGSNFSISRWADVGNSQIDIPFTIARNTGVVGLNNGATTLTPTKGDSSTNLATTQFVAQFGIQSGGQQLSPAGVFTVTRAHAGFNWLLGSTTTSVVMPSSGAAASGTYLFSSYGGNTAAIPFTFPSGSDWKASILPGEKVILCGDGGGYYRVIAQGWEGGAPKGVQAGTTGYETSPAGFIDQWGLTGTIASGTVATAITFPVAFPNSVFNIIIGAAGNPGTGGMAYYWYSAATRTGFTLNTAGAAACQYTWRAKGN